MNDTDKINKDKLEGYIVAFKRYAPYYLGEDEYKKKLEALETQLNKAKDENR